MGSDGVGRSRRIGNASPMHRRRIGDATPTSATHRRHRRGENLTPHRAASHRRYGAILRPHPLGPHPGVRTPCP
eukprot:5730621-Pyramimonas_sp.AAC.1